MLDPNLLTIRVDFRAPMALYAALVALSIIVDSLLHVTGRVGRAALLLRCMSCAVRCLETNFGGRNGSSSANGEAKEGVSGARGNRALIYNASSAEPDVEKLPSPAPAPLTSRRILRIRFRGTCGSASILGGYSAVSSGYW